MRKRFNELRIEVTKNREKLKEQRQLIDFLLEHDRKDIIFNIPTNPLYNVMGYCLEATYIYTNKISVAKIMGNIWVENDGGYNIAVPNKAEVIENDDEKFVVKVQNKDNLFAPRYYRVVKHNSQVADVTEYYPQEEPPTDANPDAPTTSCENCAKKSNCKLQNKVNFSELMPKMIVCDEFTPTENDFEYFTADQVRKMSQKEVKENYKDIMKSMKKWG